MYSSYRGMHARRGSRSNAPIWIAVAAVVLVALIGWSMSSYLKDSPVTITVTGKESPRMDTSTAL